MTEKEADAKLTVAINMRVSPDDAARLDSLSNRIRITTRHGVARAALRLGLALLEEDPARVMDDAPQKRRRGR